MTRGSSLISLALIALLALAAAGCSDRDRGNGCQDNTTYYKDHRVGICFAHHGRGIATVDCDKVEKFLRNP